MNFQCTHASVTLAAVDLKTLIVFYTSILGQPAIHLSDVYVEFELPGLRLGIFKPQATHRAEFQAGKSGMSLCLEVSDLEGAIAHLTTLGYSPPGEILTASHGKEIYTYDPDGNRLILHQSC